MAACDADGDAKVAVRIRAGWRHEWRRPPPNVKVHQIVPGPFKKSLPLVNDTPFYFIETKHFRTRHPRRKRLSPEMIAERRCAAIRTGIPDPWADYLTFRGTPAAITKVSAEDKDLWSARLDLTESAWKKHGIKLTQGIPNPWEFWPKFGGLDSGDNDCPCVESKPAIDCPCVDPAPPIKDLDETPQLQPVQEIPPKKTPKKPPSNSGSKNKSRGSFSCWKKRKRTQPQNAVQPMFYQPQWEFESQPCKSCGFSEPQVQPLGATSCGSQPSATKSCDCSKQRIKQEKICSCVEKQPKQQNKTPLPEVAPSPRKSCGCSARQKPPPDVPRPLPEKSCTCSEKSKPPPPPVIANPSPEKVCGCSEKPKPSQRPSNIAKPSSEKRCTCSEKAKQPPPPPLVDAKPPPEKSCECSINPKPLPVAVKPAPPLVVANRSPESFCRCSEKPKLQPPAPVIAKPAPGNYCEFSGRSKPPSQGPVVAKPAANNYCELSENPKPPPASSKPAANNDCGCSEKPKFPPVRAKVTADCNCSSISQDKPKARGASEVPLPAKNCGCSLLTTPPLLIDISPVSFRECSQQTDSPKQSPPPRPPPPKCIEQPVPTLTQQPLQPISVAEVYWDFPGASSTLTPVEKHHLPAKTCGDNLRHNSQLRPQIGGRSSSQKARACREIGYLQSTDSPDRHQEQANPIDTKSTAVQCDSLECIQGETVVAKIGPTYLQDDDVPQSNLQCPTCKANVAEKDLQRLEELWRDYEKRKENPFSVSPQGERKAVPESYQIVFDEDNFDDGGESNAPKRRGRLGSILKSSSCDNPESEAPAKRVSISIPEDESSQFFRAEEDGSDGPRKKCGRLPHRTSSGNISDVSSYARASIAGSVTSDTFLSRLNTATGASSRSERVANDSDEEVQIATVNLDDIAPLTRQMSSVPSIESFFSRMQGSKETLSNHSVSSKLEDGDPHGSVGSQAAVKSQDSVCPITYSNSKFQPNASWPSHESNASVLSGMQSRMERIEEMQNTFAAEDDHNDDQWREEGDTNSLHNIGVSEPFVMNGSPNEIMSGDKRDYFHDGWESAPSDTLATKDTDEPDQDFEESESFAAPTSPSRRDKGNRRRPLSEKSQSTHIVGVPDLEPRHRRHCYACQMQEEEERLKAMEAEKEGKKRASSAKRSTSAGRGNRDEKRSGHTPNYWVEKREKGMAYYADDEAVVIADPRSVNAKVSVIPKKREHKSPSSAKNERRNRVLLEQEVYRPKHMGKTREYDFFGSTIRGRDSGRGYPGMGGSGSPETSRSDNAIECSHENTSSTQNIYFDNVSAVSPNNSFFGNATGPTPKSNQTENSVRPIPQISHSGNTPRPTLMQGYLESGKGITTQNKYTENQTGRDSDCGNSSACYVCCKPSVLNLVPNRAVLSNNRPLEEYSGLCQEFMLKSQAISPNRTGTAKVYKSGCDVSGSSAVPRKGHKKHERCYDDCDPTLCSGCESSSHIKTIRSDRVLSQQSAARPSHLGKTREYEFLGSSGKTNQQVKGKDTDSCTFCCKSTDCYDPNHSDKISNKESHSYGELGTRMSSMRRTHHSSHGSCEICCNTSSCASNDGQQQAKESRNKVMLQQEAVRPKHMGKTREYDLPGTDSGTARSENKSRNDSSGPKECPVPVYDSNTFLVDPIQLIKPSKSGGGSQDRDGPRDCRESSVAPTDDSCVCPSDEVADANSLSNDGKHRSKGQRKNKNARSMFVSQPKRH